MTPEAIIALLALTVAVVHTGLAFCKWWKGRRIVHGNLLPSTGERPFHNVFVFEHSLAHLQTASTELRRVIVSPNTGVLPVDRWPSTSRYVAYGYTTNTMIFVDTTCSLPPNYYSSHDQYCWHNAGTPAYS